ncbi:MAG: helix-turn-helix transcriptional regulator [Clostridiales bacterium]|nr:helix-turn-helix transcriptional regulator [Clostridiales bacterium]
MVNLGEKLKALRKSNNMTQKDLADRIGVSKSIISSYESGTRYPSYDVLVKMARIFHVSTDYLFGLEKKKVLDASELTDAEIEAIKRLITIFIENRKRR